MDRFLLSIGALSYGVVLALFTVQFFDVSLATSILLPLLVLTGLGIAATAGGLVARGKVAFYNADTFLASAVLGAIGFFGWEWGAWRYQHIVAICDYSKFVPTDTSVLWACPAAMASYYAMWIFSSGSPHTSSTV